METFKLELLKISIVSVQEYIAKVQGGKKIRSETILQLHAQNFTTLWSSRPRSSRELKPVL